MGVILGFTLVSYFDCSHHTYKEVVADRPHMVAVTFGQISTMCVLLALFLAIYVLSLTIALVAGSGRKVQE